MPRTPPALPAPAHFGAAAVVFAVLACGGGGSPSGTSDLLVVNPATATLTSATDSIRVTGTVKDAPAINLRLALASESREIPELPVLSAEALQRGVLLPAGPGTAVVNATAASATGTKINVQVAPTAPAVFGVITTQRGNGSDTTTILGSRLDEVAMDAVQLGGNATPILTRTASAIRVSTPAAPTICTGVGLSRTVTVAGTSVTPGLKLWLPRADEVRLGVNEWRVLTSEEAACVRLPAANATYVLAYADAGPIEAARTQWSPPPYAFFTVNVADRANSAPSMTQGRIFGSAPSVHQRTHLTHVHAAAPPASPVAASTSCSDDVFLDFQAFFWCRSKPWAAGDKMTIRRPHSQVSDTVTATVYQVYGGKFVFAAIDGDNSQQLQKLRATIDSVMPSILSVAVPVIQNAYGTTYPVTSAGSGQLLTIIGDFQHGSVGSGFRTGEVPWAVVLLGSTLANDRAQTFHLLAHEFTHTWQQRWMHDERPAGAQEGYTGSYWGHEGGADLVSLEAVRRWANMPWAANRSIYAFIGNPGLGAAFIQELNADGTLAQGYTPASSFQRDLVARLVRSGLSVDAAFQEVARGVLEDWFGIDPDGSKRPGLTERMRAHLGTQWEPGPAFLLYLLSQVADDRNNNPALQNPFWENAWQDFGGDWRRVELRAGEHGQFSASRLHMSGGALLLRLPGTAGTFQVTSTDLNVRWAIARIP
jgi:hypothetical protein